jgi:hypothetical protein
MPRFSIISALAVGSIIWSQAIGESVDCKSTTIPLDKIWAYEMPGTRDIRGLDTVSKTEPAKGLVGPIVRSWMMRFESLRPEEIKSKSWARSGFVVPGSGHAALQAAYAIFVRGEKARTSFLPDEEITIVFFSEPPSKYRVIFQQIQRKGNEIEIRYQLEPSISGRNFDNFALIPLGRLSAGKYCVEMHQVPRELKPVEAKLGLKPLNEEWGLNFLCKTFRFSVAKKRAREWS